MYVRPDLDRYGVTEAVGKDAYFETVVDVMKAYQQKGS
jgi:hypothetical protein